MKITKLMRGLVEAAAQDLSADPDIPSDWPDRVDLSTLDIFNSRLCVLGQATGSFFTPQAVRLRDKARLPIAEGRLTPYAPVVAGGLTREQMATLQRRLWTVEIGARRGWTCHRRRLHDKHAAHLLVERWSCVHPNQRQEVTP